MVYKAGSLSEETSQGLSRELRVVGGRALALNRFAMPELSRIYHESIFIFFGLQPSQASPVPLFFYILAVSKAYFNRKTIYTWYQCDL